MTNPTLESPAPSPPAQTPAQPPNRTRWWIVGSSVVVAILLLGAIGLTAALVGGGDDDDDDRFERDEISAVVPDRTVERDDQALIDASTITPDRASALAEKAAGSGTATDVDIDDDTGTVVYEVEVQDQTVNPVVEKDVVVDADSGKIISVIEDRG